MFLGSREDVAHLGYVQGVCPKCHKAGSFTVYLAKRKMTISMFAQVPMGEQHLLECRACGARFALPPEMKEQLQARLITADRLADLVDQLPSQEERDARPVRTLYQVLQVDQDADPDVIEAAFKRLALKYHPDRSKDPEAAAKMREVLAARNVLEDGKRRLAYDASIGIRREPPRTPALRPEEV
ncbi:MAG TPA: DnaJ domain-containing protein [Thermomicrobiales bacterium]|nr:DnaJ domain-containing protein [Thermomicrobiales bacterium]HRA47494.1 DnaJ domain-containing protein [Thermomicrobiales bacterium]